MRRLDRCACLCWAFVIGFLAVPHVAWAEGKGQEDLDQAIELQLTAATAKDLKKVADLCESALEKGLDEGNKKFAQQLASSTLLQYAQALAQAVVGQPQPGEDSWREMRKQVIESLDKATKYSEDMADAYLLKAQMLMLPGGGEKSRERAKAAVEKALALLDEDPEKKSRAYLLRAGLATESDEQVADLTKAIETNPENAEALQLRAMLHVQRKDLEKAAADMNELLKIAPDNVGALRALVQVYLGMNDFDKALEQIEAIIRIRPDSAFGYRLRAGVYLDKQDYAAALEALEAGLDVAPDDLETLLMRANVYDAQGDYDNARLDVDQVLDLRPDLPEGLLLRSQISTNQAKFTDAVADMQTLVDLDPRNPNFRLRLAMLSSMDSRPRKAIDEYSKVLQVDEQNWNVLRLRADVLLSIGQHKEAIRDFSVVVELQPSDAEALKDQRLAESISNVLNNYAWVLATSPDDDLRDAQKSIELGKRACEITKYEAPHILSTFAAGYAEQGDFETAKKWSSEAVTRAEARLAAAAEEEREQMQEQLEQLRQELESYRKEKPWRERQDTKENTDPIQPVKPKLRTQ